MKADLCYQTIIEEILREGQEVETRNSKTKRLTNLMYCFRETPLVSVRKTAWKNALREWEWFMTGSCDIDELHPSVHSWWKPWTDESGVILNNYSQQFRHSTYKDEKEELSYFDQIKALQEGVASNPYSRRNVITTWNSGEMSLPTTPITNCHGSLIQCFVNLDNTLDMTMYQRSCDTVLGMQHNWIQYWAFLTWLAATTGRDVGKLTWIGGDCHIYEDHFPLAQEIVDTNIGAIEPTKLIYKDTDKIFKADDFSLEGSYTPLITKRPKMIV